MPKENKLTEPRFDLDTPDGGRRYIAELFKTVLRRHDYRQYINERLAGDFACTLAQHLEECKAREQALHLRLNAADQRIDEQCALMRRLVRNVDQETCCAEDLEQQDDQFNYILKSMRKAITAPQ